MDSDFMLTTANNLEGYVIVKQCGIVFGETVFKNSALNSLGAVFSDMVDSFRLKETEMSGSLSLIERARKYAYKKIIAEAKNRGANAIIAIDSDNTISSGNIMYLSLYGTAVKVVPAEEYAENKHRQEEEKQKKRIEVEEDRIQKDQIKEAVSKGEVPGLQSFLNEIVDCTSMMEICNIWNRYQCAELYPEIGIFLKKKMDIEQMYGKGNFNIKNTLTKLSEMCSRYSS